MSDLQQLTQDQYGIVVLRELRKAGFDASPLRRERRSTVAGDDDAYTIDYLVTLSGNSSAPLNILLECRRQAAAVGTSAIEALRDRAEENDSAAAMFATSGYTKDAAGHARVHGVALFRVADGRAAWTRSAWGGPSAPSWIPDFMLELAGLGPAGDIRYELVQSGHASKVLERLTPSEPNRS